LSFQVNAVKEKFGRVKELVQDGGRQSEKLSSNVADGVLNFKEVPELFLSIYYVFLVVARLFV